MSNTGRNTFKILIADDSDDDRFLMRAAISLVPGLKIVAEVPNGTQAVAYLHGLGQFRDRKQYPMPDLLLLDLKMPFKDGFEVLKWLKEEPIKGMLVVVLTDSMQPENIKRALDLGADYYLVKARSHDDRASMVRAFEEYLMTAAKHSRHKPATENPPDEQD